MTQTASSPSPTSLSTDSTIAGTTEAVLASPGSVPSNLLEDALAATERAGTEAEHRAHALVSATKELQKAAARGDLAKLHRALDTLRDVIAGADAAAAAAAASWTLTPPTEEAHLRRGYDAELQAAAVTAGLRMVSQDERLIAFPSVLRIAPSQRAVEVDRRRVTTLRPSYLVKELLRAQSKKPKVSPERFIETLHSAYRLVVGGLPEGSTGVTLDRVYAALTLMPDVRRDYAQTDFGRDIYFLDRSGVQNTRSGARITFPASSGTRGSKHAFQFVSPDGERVTYYAVRFTDAVS